MAPGSRASAGWWSTRASRASRASETSGSFSGRRFCASPLASPSPHNGDNDMTSEDVQDFVTRFAAAWAARDGNAFLELWHPDGTLLTPLVERPLKGSE